MEIRNLEQEQVEALEEKLTELKKENPAIEHRVFPMDELEKGKADSEMLQLILDKLEGLERQISLIFDGHVLMNGQFMKIVNCPTSVPH